MYIAIVAAECAPAAKAGGLGDFVQGLARELAARGHELEVFLPRYDCLRFESIADLHKVYEGLQVPFYGDWIRCDVECGWSGGTRCLFVDPQSPEGFFRRGVIYGEPDDADRFAFFSRAVLEVMHRSGRHPDIIHCNDWHTGLLPVLLYDVYAGLGMTHPRVCFTLHNLGYQGRSGEFVCHQVGLDPQRVMTSDRLLDPEKPRTANLLKGGIVYANHVTTVSPRYAWEIRFTDQGMGLQETLRIHGEKLTGILNGIDGATWDPRSDGYIARHFGPDSLPEKAVNKSELRNRFGLEQAHKPLVSVISRLDQQKGVELIAHAVRHSLSRGCQVVLLGSAQEPAIAARFLALKGELRGNPDCHLELGYDERLAHQIYAAADIIVIPSLYEPCGLTQMIAMKYAVVPVARRVGGLADTVFDANLGDQPFEQRNGYLFDDPTPQGLESALDRAIGLWFEYPQYFRQLRLNGMTTDHSWRNPAQKYVEIYEQILA